MSKEDFYMWKRLGYESYGEYMIHKKPDPNKAPVVTYRYCANCGDRLTGGRIRFCSLECRQNKRRKETEEAQNAQGN